MINSFALQRLPLSFRARVLTSIPSLLRPALQLLPYQAQKALLLPILNAVFKGAIGDNDFAFLQDKWLRISVIDLDLHWYLSVDHTKLIMAPQHKHIEEDVSFSATGDDLLLIAGRKQDPDTLFFQRRLKIEGDTELGLEVKNLIDAIEIEHLPKSIHTLVDVSATLVQQTRDDLSAQQ